MALSVKTNPLAGIPAVFTLPPHVPIARYKKPLSNSKKKALGTQVLLLLPLPPRHVAREIMLQLCLGT